MNEEIIMKKQEINFENNLPFSIEVKAIKNYPIHYHEDVTEIILPIKGSVEVIANFEHVLVKEGDFWFINNKCIHSIRSSSKAIVVVFYIDLNYFQRQYEYIKYMFFRCNMYSKSKGRTKIESDNFDDELRKGYKTRFRNLLMSVLTDAISPDPSTKELTRDSMLQLVASMVQEFNWLQFLKKRNDFISPLHLERYHKIVKFIDDHYKEKITVDDIAKQEFITNNYFSHFWKDLSYFSFKERLNYERALKSEFLLLTTDMNINSIAEECGFSDVKYYYKHFRIWYGTSPLEHKKRCFNYMAKEFNYDILNLPDVEEIIYSYLKDIVLLEYGQNNTWKTTSLFNNFIRMKYLYKIDKISPQRSPRNVMLDIFHSNNFKMKENESYFNWQNIDLLVNFTETSDFDINIKFDCHYLDEKWYENAVYSFLESCIYRYRIITIKKWNFFINYYDEVSLNQANTIGDIINNIIQDANIRYFFEL